MALLLVGTAVGYFWNLSANGWANSFYAAAVQAGAKSWKAFFFGSSDWGNSITVDKTPASLWPMEISVRVFGLHSWSMLLPQVLLGLGSVALIWVTVRRVAGPVAGLLGGVALAVTPVAALMFRFNNPDAALVFLMLAAVWAMTRALADGRWRWLVLCGLFVGLGFLAKQLQVMLVLPALAVTYLVAGPPRLGARVLQLLAAGVAVVVGAGWWVLIAQLWPSASRPYFGGSEHNSTMELAFGYNGLDRLGVGGDSGFPGPPPGGGSERPRFNFFGSEPGLPRLFSETVGGQVAWLIPAALVLVVVAIILRGRAPRTDPQRSALLLWGGWALVTGLVFSFMRGIFHQYYTVALAPAVAGTLGLGVVLVWREREKIWVRAALAFAMALTTATAVVFLWRTPSFVPWLRWAVLAIGVIATIALLIPSARRPAPGSAGPGRFALGSAVLATVAGLAAPVAYSIQTIALPHNGGIVLAGPRTGSGFPWGPGPGGPGAGGPGGQPGTGGPGAAGDQVSPGGSGSAGGQAGPGGSGSAGGQAGPGGPGGPDGGAAPGVPGNAAPGDSEAPDRGDAPEGDGTSGGPAVPGAPGTPAGPATPDGPGAPNATDSTGRSPGVPGGLPGAGGDGQQPQPAGDGKPGNGTGGPRGSDGSDDEVVALLRASSSGYTWAAATIGSMGQADLQLNSGQAVMPIGGFGGGDPSPTLEQFQQYVATGRIHYFVTDNRGPGGGGPGRNKDSASAKISQWVKDHYIATAVGDSVVYDLTATRIP
nr:glycosyltransferase family 39 protein [Nocardia aurantia]